MKKHFSEEKRGRYHERTNTCRHQSPQKLESNTENIHPVSEDAGEIPTDPLKGGRQQWSVLWHTGHVTTTHVPSKEQGIHLTRNAVRMVYMERVRTLLYSQGSPVNGISREAFASFSSLLVYRNRCCRGSSRNDSPQAEEGETTIRLFFQGRILLWNHLRNQGLI